MDPSNSVWLFKSKFADDLEISLKVILADESFLSAKCSSVIISAIKNETKPIW